jgi:hypothetical protein
MGTNLEKICENLQTHPRVQNTYTHIKEGNFFRGHFPKFQQGCSHQVNNCECVSTFSWHFFWVVYYRWDYPVRNFCLYGNRSFDWENLRAGWLQLRKSWRKLTYMPKRNFFLGSYPVNKIFLFYICVRNLNLWICI